MSGAPNKPVSLLTKWKFLQRLFADRRLNEADLRVAGVLADHFNVKKSKAYPSLSRLAIRTGLSQSTVQRALARLEKKAIVTKRSGGRGRANEYTLAFADYGHSSDYSHSSDQGGWSQLRPGGVVTAVTTHTSYSPEHQAKGSRRGIPAAAGASALDASAPPRGAPATDLTANDQTAATDLMGEFEQFWTAYPRKEGRDVAKKQFAEVRANGVPLHTLMAKAQQYATAKADIDSKWIKMPANWLRGEGWLEDPQPPKPRTAKAGDRTAGKTKDRVVGKTKVSAGKSKAGNGANVVPFPKPKPSKPEKPKPSYPDLIGKNVWHAELGTCGQIVEVDFGGTRARARVVWTHDDGNRETAWIDGAMLSLNPIPPDVLALRREQKQIMGARVEHKNNSKLRGTVVSIDTSKDEARVKLDSNGTIASFQRLWLRCLPETAKENEQCGQEQKQITVGSRVEHKDDGVRGTVVSIEASWADAGEDDASKDEVCVKLDSNGTMTYWNRRWLRRLPETVKEDEQCGQTTAS
jgi:hypothetical protein